MTLRVCPIASVHAPVKRVWDFLSEPSNYALWWDAITRSVEPRGPAQAGQRIHARSRGFGILWNIHVLVEQVDEARHTLDVMATIPLGIFLFIHINCAALDARSCQISFGCEFSFSPVWWGWLLERYGSQQLYAAVASSLSRLKQAAEAA